jgi:post-segregation antitoxin (ccd killing protein)
VATYKESAMSKRLNISIPEELYNQLQAYKDRMNISKVCQHGLRKGMQEVDRIEAEQAELAEVLKAMAKAGRTAEVIQEMEDYDCTKDAILDFLKEHGKPDYPPKKKIPNKVNS